MPQLKDITVPSGYKHLMKRERIRFDDCILPIRRVIESHPGEVIHGEAFIEATGTTAATAHVRKLIDRGYIERKKARNTGHKGWNFTYTWHEIPLKEREAALANGKVHTKKLDLQPFNISKEAMLELDCAFLNWSESQSSGDYILGAISFKRFVKHELEKHEEAKAQALAELTKA